MQIKSFGSVTNTTAFKRPTFTETSIDSDGMPPGALVPDSEVGNYVDYKIICNFTHYESNGVAEEYVPHVSHICTGSQPVLIREFKRFMPYWSKKIRFVCGGNFSDVGRFITSIGCANPTLALQKYNELFPTNYTAMTSNGFKKKGAPYVYGFASFEELVHSGYVKMAGSTPGDDQYGRFMWNPWTTNIRDDDFIAVVGVAWAVGSARRNATVEMWSG